MKIIKNKKTDRLEKVSNQEAATLVAEGTHTYSSKGALRRQNNADKRLMFYANERFKFTKNNIREQMKINKAVESELA